LLAGAATCHQDFHPAACRRAVESRQRKRLTQICLDTVCFPGRRDFDPARIGIFFVLTLNEKRDVVLDVGQLANGGAYPLFLRRFADLLRQKCPDLLGP
jgi:hypothetical protein